MTRDEAWDLLTEYVSSQSLRKHCMAVEAAMRHYARHFGEDEALWGVTGLIHDFDYERWPNPPDHTRKGAEILRQRGVDEEIVSAILSHADWNQADYPRDRPIRKTLYAVDELCGFIMAVALMRPDKMAGMTPKSVKKKLKQKAFAAAISREDIARGIELIALDGDEHFKHCIDAMTEAAEPLELT
jgi:putative nucleotidyltransferase with HDIG domain